MNVAWIIGNGFDLRLGLRTGYKTFVDECYLKSPMSPEKERLISRIKSHEDSWGGDVWSDLELLSGRITADYSVDEKVSYYRAFQGMTEELSGYLLKEQNRFEEAILPKVDFGRFFASVFQLNKRLAIMDGEFVGDWTSIKDNFIHEFISLNYTNTLDSIIAKCSDDQNLKKKMTRQYPGVGAYTYRFGRVIHIHGTLGAEGGIVFCVNDAAQILNPSFSNDPQFIEAFTKVGRNELFGMRRTDAAFSVLDKAKVIVIYGCSLGETDAYLWKHVLDNLVNRPDTKLLLFAYDMPRNGGLDIWGFQQIREYCSNTLLSFYNLDDKDKQDVSNRIKVLSSDYLFDLVRQEK